MALDTTKNVFLMAPQASKTISALITEAYCVDRDLDTFKTLPKADLEAGIMSVSKLIEFMGVSDGSTQIIGPHVTYTKDSLKNLRTKLRNHLKKAYNETA